jgi:hypothetical protein
MIVSRAIAGGGSAARLNDRQNAVRARETVRVAAGICSADADPLEREQALVVAGSPNRLQTDPQNAGANR